MTDAERQRRRGPYFAAPQPERVAETRLRVFSNIPDLPNGRPDDLALDVTLVDEKSTTLAGAWRIDRQSRGADVILLNDATRLAYGLCLLRWLWPARRPPLILLDLLLNKPTGWLDGLKARARRLLLAKVDHFIHYFKDWEGYSKYYGIGADRSRYLPFKVNGWESIPPIDELDSDGEYILTSGRSLRDFSTFLHAVGQVPYSARLVYHDRQLMREHGSELSGCQLPGNLRVMEDDGSPESWMASIRRAKLVVIPVHPDSLRAVGVGMCLVAMALRKCVIITEGHATRGIINDEALVVPPSDPAALAQAIRRGWEDDVLRQRVADNGRRYAEQVRDATRLYSDLLEACAEISQSSLSREASAR